MSRVPWPKLWCCCRYLTNPAKDFDLRKWAAEGLSYLTLDADVKEELCRDTEALSALFGLAKSPDKTVTYGVVSCLVNCTNTYDKNEDAFPEMVELAKYAKHHIPEQHEKVTDWLGCWYLTFVIVCRLVSLDKLFPLKTEYVMDLYSYTFLLIVEKFIFVSLLRSFMHFYDPLCAQSQIWAGPVMGKLWPGKFSNPSRETCRNNITKATLFWKV